MLKIAYAPIYKYRLPEGHRFPMIKYELLPEQLIREGTISEDNFFAPDSFSREQLSTTHTTDYIHRLHNRTLTKKEVRAIGFPLREDLLIRGRHIAYGTYQCALYAMDHGVAMNIAGGTKGFVDLMI